MSGDCDCVECHFRYEEERVLLLVPASDAAWIRAEHRDLLARGKPHAEMMDHAEREMRVFRRHAPQWMLDKLDREHSKFAGEPADGVPGIPAGDTACCAECMQNLSGTEEEPCEPCAGKTPPMQL